MRQAKGPEGSLRNRGRPIVRSRAEFSWRSGRPKIDRDGLVWAFATPGLLIPSGTMPAPCPVEKHRAADTADGEDRYASLRLPLVRLLQLVMILQSGRFPNAQRLADACAVSRRTIYRDLAILEAAGIPAVYRPDRQGYQLAVESFLQPAQLDDQEALALLFLSRL